MKKIALALALAAISGAAMAEWTPMGRLGDANVYVDPATIRRSGNTVTMWILFDEDFIKYQDNRAYMSARWQSEFDCNETRSRILYIDHFTGKMGRGGMVDGHNPYIGWLTTEQGTFVGQLQKFACGKK